MEHQSKNLINTLLKDLGSENTIKFLEEIKNCITQKSEEIIEEPYKNIEFPDKKITPNLTQEDLRNLKYSEKITEVERNIRYYINDENKTSVEIEGYTLIEGKRFYLYFLLSRKDKRSFLNIYGTKQSFLCKCVITYSPDLDRYFIFNLEIYEISEPFRKWKKLMEGKKFPERIEILLEILNLNPQNLYYHEKLIPIIRLIPLVVRKTFMVELSKKMLGKTYCYESLGFNLYNTGVTRATAFLDGRDRERGDFFYETIAFIIDEFHKVEEKGVINTLQIYMSGDKYIGAVQIPRVGKMESNVSPIALANAKVKINADEIFTNNKGENGKAISIFENTLFLNSPDGEAIVSRINLLPNSWGCRGFNSFMKAEKINYYNIELLKAVIPILRNKEFNITEFYEKMGVTWQSPSIRSSDSVEKNFEGLVKLIFPEFLEGISKNEVERHFNELWFLFERACEMRKTVDNQLKIINPNENSEQTLPTLRSKLKRVMFDIKEPHFFDSHRIFIKKADGTIEKIPLDIIGIEHNRREKKILDQKKYPAELKNNEILTHSSTYSYDFSNSLDMKNNLGVEKNLNFSNTEFTGSFNTNFQYTNLISCVSGTRPNRLRVRMSIPPIILNNNTVANNEFIKAVLVPQRVTQINRETEISDKSNELSYNFLIGEKEELENEDIDFIKKYTFYNLDI